MLWLAGLATESPRQRGELGIQLKQAFVGLDRPELIGEGLGLCVGLLDDLVALRAQGLRPGDDLRLAASS